MKKLTEITVLALMIVVSNAHAGSWGAGSFENDSAADWVYELESSKSPSFLLTVFAVVPPAGYIEVDTCSAAIAAADVVAALKDGKTKQLPKVVATWVKSNESGYKPNMATKALEVISFCKSMKRSELAQLWKEGQSNNWLSQISKIEARLQ
ncbi:DUF4259 domain-containing protein [Pseudomonas sp. HK3]